MVDEQPNNPLHGITLKAIVEDLVERRGWGNLAAQIEIPCFLHEPSITSSLKYLRKDQWARQLVEELYVDDQRTLRRRRESSPD